MNMFERDKRIIVINAGRTKLSLIKYGRECKPLVAPRDFSLYSRCKQQAFEGVSLNQGRIGAD